MFMLIGVAMVGVGFTGYQAGTSSVRVRVAALIMAISVGVVIELIVDLDQPARGLVRVPVQALVDAAAGVNRHHGPMGIRLEPPALRFTARVRAPLDG